MPELKTNDLFISYVWRKKGNWQYYRLVNLLKVIAVISFLYKDVLHSPRTLMFVTFLAVILLYYGLHKLKTKLHDIPRDHVRVLRISKTKET